MVNLDVPQTPEDYVHRLGRAGRTDMVGDAFTLMSPDEQKDVEAIERFLGRAIPRVQLPDFDYEMTPGEMKPLAASEENGNRALRAGGVGVAANRIAAVTRGSAAPAAAAPRPRVTAAQPLPRASAPAAPSRVRGASSTSTSTATRGAARPRATATRSRTAAGPSRRPVRAGSRARGHAR